MRVCFLGTGTSQGVPIIAKDYPKEFLENPKNHRLRPSIYVETEKTALVVDTSPEFRLQMLREKIKWLDAVLITHAHADHIMGMDDCRRFCDLRPSHTLPIYASEETMNLLHKIFFYAFADGFHPSGYFVPEQHIVSGPFNIGDLEIHPQPLDHVYITSYGYLFIQDGVKKLAYLTDAKTVSQEVIANVHGVEVAVLDGLRLTSHPTHLCLAEALEIAKKIQAKTTYLTHLTHEYNHDIHEKYVQEQNSSVHLAYDGLWLTI